MTTHPRIVITEDGSVEIRRPIEDFALGDRPEKRVEGNLKGRSWYLPICDEFQWTIVRDDKDCLVLTLLREREE